MALAASRDAEAKRGQGRDRGGIGHEGAHRLLIRQHGEDVLEIAEERPWRSREERGDDRRQCLGRLRSEGRQVEPIAIVLPRDPDGADAGQEFHVAGDAMGAGEDMRGCERGMAAEIDLVHRREPAQVPSTAIRPGKGGLGEIVLVGDGLHRRLGQPIVEDEDGLRALNARGLTSRGYTVLEASNGVEAIEAFDKHGQVDLVVSDVVMPEMDGPTLLKELRRRDQNVKIIFVSGYAEEAFSKNLPGPEEYEFLPKPFTLKQLVAKVKTTLVQ